MSIPKDLSYQIKMLAIAKENPGMFDINVRKQKCELMISALDDEALKAELTRRVEALTE